MSSYRSLSDKRSARFVLSGAALLFILYGFIYLLTSGNDLLTSISAALVSKTSISLATNHQVVALLTTLLILVIQPMIRFLSNAKVSHVLATYIPSFLILALLMVVGRTVQENPHRLLWVVASLVLVDFVLCWICLFVKALRRVDPRHYDSTGIYRILPWAITNFFGFCLLGAATLGIIKFAGEQSFVIESAASVQEEKPSAVLSTKGEKGNLLMSLDKTIALNSELYKSHLLGDRMFRYSQNFKSAGLGKPDAYTSQTKDVATYDYHMAGLLLDKNLETFYKDMKRYHEFHTDSFPAHYTEAFIMYRFLHPKSHLKIHNPYFNIRFKRYVRYSRHPKSQKLEFGKTFWWYFDHK